MNTKYVVLWLEAPMQSWGVESKFGRRDTLNFPTKSGVLGILLCAMGATGEQKELLAEFADLLQTVISFNSVEQQNDEVKKKEREALLMDFHMVGAGYNEKDPIEALHIPKTSSGDKAVGGGTKMTYRYYLQDAKFAAVLEVPESRVQLIEESLTHPVFDVYLGRKCCVPADFIFRGIYDDEKDAFTEATRIAHAKGLREEFRVIDGDEMTLNDVPVQFGIQKLYRERRVQVIYSDE